MRKSTEESLYGGLESVGIVVPFLGVAVRVLCIAPKDIPVYHTDD